MWSIRWSSCRSICWLSSWSISWSCGRSICWSRRRSRSWSIYWSCCWSRCWSICRPCSRSISWPCRWWFIRRQSWSRCGSCCWSISRSCRWSIDWFCCWSLSLWRSIRLSIGSSSLVDHIWRMIVVTFRYCSTNKLISLSIVGDVNDCIWFDNMNDRCAWFRLRHWRCNDRRIDRPTHLILILRRSILILSSLCWWSLCLIMRWILGL